jgi:hypothetical protein
MDGLSALSVAASVAQFIEFGCSLVSKSKEIHKSAHGLTTVYVEAENATHRLLELNRRLTRSLDIEKQLRTMAQATPKPSKTSAKDVLRFQKNCSRN